ncbi:MAG TPA: hypothetical protein PK593_03485, partial [Thermomicrobiales bacterium]|nr:hypothetical protein [Thermomicrobiales bacterium]
LLLINADGSGRRALVDGGAANPSDAILTAYQIVGVHSFTFVLDTVTAGTHVVEAQWLVDSGHTASMGDRSLSIAAAPSNLATGGLVTRWAHGAAISNTSNSWTPVPDMSASITTVNGANLAISVTAESFTSSSMGRMWVRARVDGQPTTPDDVVFAQGNAGGTQWRSHSMTFSAKGLSAGSHNVQIEWLGDPPYTAYMGDRTLAVHASPASASAGVLTTTSVTSSWINTGSTSWATIPNMTASIVTPAGSTVAIRLSGEVDASIGGRMFVRALVDGQPASPSDVMFVAYTDWGGTRAFTFTVTNVTAGTHTVEMQWHADAGLYATIGDRTLTIMGWPTH